MPVRCTLGRALFLLIAGCSTIAGVPVSAARAAVAARMPANCAQAQSAPGSGGSASIEAAVARRPTASAPT